MRFFRSKLPKTSPVEETKTMVEEATKELFMLDTLRLIRNCELTSDFDSLLAGQQVDHCRTNINGDESLVYVCGRHIEAAAKTGIIEAIVVEKNDA